MKVWISLLVIYSSFFIWYTDLGGKLSDEEIKSFISQLERNGVQDNIPEDRARAFLSSMTQSKGCQASILTAVHDTNQRQKNKPAERVIERLGANLSGKTVAVWGLSFKPNTDDIREAPSLSLLEHIWSCGGSVRAFDPEAMAVCHELYGDRDDMTYVENKYDALKGADCVVICTEWKTFWSPDFEIIKDALKEPIVIDGRNLYDPKHLAAMGIEYYGIGRGLSVAHP